MILQTKKLNNRTIQVFIDGHIIALITEADWASGQFAEDLWKLGFRYKLIREIDEMIPPTLGGYDQTKELSEGT